MPSDMLLKGKKNSGTLIFISTTQCPSLNSLLEVMREEYGETKMCLIETEREPLTKGISWTPPKERDHVFLGQANTIFGEIVFLTWTFIPTYYLKSGIIHELCHMVIIWIITISNIHKSTDTAKQKRKLN